MSIVCDKCNRTLSSLRRLNTHKEKSVPCDFQCRTCNFKAISRRQYDYHVKNKHEVKEKNQKKDKEEETEVEEIEPIRIKRFTTPNDLIPIQDFNRRGLDDYLRELEDLATDMDSEITVKITVRPRIKRAIEALTSSDYANSLSCLDKGVNKAAVDYLSHLHGDPKRPFLHSIKIADYARNKVKIYSRPNEDSESKWLSYTQNAALTTLSNHMSNVLSFSVKRAMEDMKPKYMIKEKVPCFCFHDTTKKQNVIIKNADETGLSALQGELDVSYYSGKLKDIKEMSEELSLLVKMIERKGEDVLKQLQDLMLTREDLEPFLEKTQRPMTKELLV